jgi:hypothetical protein
MSPEWVTAIATAGTFLVIAASATAALVQLRHMRASNQVAILSEIRSKMESPDFKRAVHFIRYELPSRMESDPDFRRKLLANACPEAEMVTDVGLYFDLEASQLVKHRMVDTTLACDWLYSPVVPCWEALAPLIASRRAMLGYNMWEDFEYLALLCKRFREKHPEGTYPHGEERLPLPTPWPEALQREQAQ